MADTSGDLTRSIRRRSSSRAVDAGHGGHPVRPEGDELFVYVDSTHSVKRAKQRILHALNESGVSHALETPLEAFRWDDGRNQYVDPRAPKAIPPVDPRHITWKVCVRPHEVWVESRLRKEIESLGRPVIGEKGRWIEIGAADEPDASKLAAKLSELPETAEATAERLSRLARWRVRQLLLGNYAY